MNTKLTSDDEATLVSFMMTLDFDVMTNLTREIVAASPGYKYKEAVEGTDPQYVDNGDFSPRYVVRNAAGKFEPSCILGQVFGRMGIDYDIVALLEELEDSGFETVYNTCWALLREDDEVTETFNPKVRWLSTVQEAQDKGFTWQEAIDLADELRRKIEKEKNPELKLSDLLATAS